MKTPTWRSRFQTDAENVKFTTRLTSLLINRFFLHVWFSLKAVWRYGLLRSLLLLPLLLLRMLFFPLQWPISLVGKSVTSFCRWITDIPLMAIGRGFHTLVTYPVQMIAAVGDKVRLRACDAAVRFLQQCRELRELGFVNAMALIPFLILRLIQGAVLSVIAACAEVLRLCWKGICAIGLAVLAGLQWIASWFSLSGSWNWVKTFCTVFIKRLGASPLFLWIRSAVAGSGQFVNSLFGRSLSLPRLPAWAGWSSFTRSFREQTAWVVVTIAGTLGLLLMLYLQWTSVAAATGHQLTRTTDVAINSQQPTDKLLVEEESPIHQGQEEPSAWSGFDQPQPFIAESEPETAPDPEPVESQPSDTNAWDDLPATQIAEEEVETSPDEEPAKAIFNPFTDLRRPKPKQAPPIQARVEEPEVEEPREEPAADLDLSVSWLPRGMTYGDAPENEFVVTTQVAPVEVALIGARANDGWREYDPTNVEPVGRPAAARMQLELPNLLAPEKNIERDIELAEVTTSAKELDLSISREFPKTAAIDGLASYRIYVRNRGRKTVDRVMVEDRLPQGARVVQTSPAGSLVDGKLIWQLDSLQPDEERLLQVDVIPTMVGAAQSFVAVRPVAAVVAQTEVRESAPQTLQLDVAAPFRVSTGEDCVIQFRVTNPGEQQVDDIILRAALPNGYEHPDGRRLDYTLGTLKAGESRHVVLVTRSTDTGSGQCRFQLLAGDDVVQTSLATVETVRSSKTPSAARIGKGNSAVPCCCRP